MLLIRIILNFPSKDEQYSGVMYHKNNKESETEII